MVCPPREWAPAIAALGVLYCLCALALAHALPGPHAAFDYMVIGAGSTGVTMLAFFLGCIVRRRSLLRALAQAPYCSKNRQTVRIPR